MHFDFAKAPIRIDLVGVDERARERFEAMFRDLGQNAHMVVNSTVAEVAIVDLDNSDGNVLWHQYCQQFPNRPVILLSGTKPSLEKGENYLRKPIHVDALLKVLDEIRPQLPILDVYWDSKSAQEPTDDVEPGTIRIADQTRWLPPACASWRGASSSAAVDREQHSKPDGESGPSWCTNGSGVVARPHGERANATTNMSLEHRPPGAALAAPSPQTFAGKLTEFDGTSEKTYRYPESPPQNPQAEESWFQRHSSSELSLPPLPADPSEPVDATELHESTRRIGVGCATPLQATFLPVHERLLGLLQSAVTQCELTQRAVELCLENGGLVVHASLKRIQSSFTDQQLKQLARYTFPSAQVRIGPYRSDSLDTSHSSTTLTPVSETIEAFLWKLALWTYRGCLPLGTHLDQRVYLRHWPNLTRLRPVPDAMRIASLWCEHPMTLGYTAKALEIPQQHVFDFYCASHTIGLAGQARREADYLFQEAVAQPKGKRRLVSDMMKRLRFIGNG